MGRRFYIVWFGQLLSTIGSDLTAFGVAFWVFAETGSTTWLAVMFGANAVPRIAITPLLGLVDRVDRRTIMLATDTGAALATMAIIAVWAIGDLRPWHLLVASLVGSTFAAVQRPAYSAALPSLVEPEVLDRANGLDQLGPGIGAIVAPGWPAPWWPGSASGPCSPSTWRPSRSGWCRWPRSASVGWPNRNRVNASVSGPLLPGSGAKAGRSAS